MIALGQLGTRNLWANPDQIAAGGIDFAAEPVTNCVMRADGKRITALNISEWLYLSGRCIVHRDVVAQHATGRAEATDQGKIFIDVRRGQLHADPKKVDHRFLDPLVRTGVAIEYPAPQFKGSFKTPYRAGTDEILVRTDRFGPVSLTNLGSIPVTGVEMVSLSGRLKVIKPSHMRQYEVLGPRVLVKRTPTGPNALVIPGSPEAIVVVSERDISGSFYNHADLPPSFYHHA